MPEAHTKHFATISYDEGAVVTFPGGLPAFEHLRRFVLLEQASTAPIVFLQSIEDANVCLPAAPIPAICPDYELAISGEDWIGLQATPGEVADLACLAVVSIAETGPATANLLAPIVINLPRRRAVQAVRSDTLYSHRHPVRAPEGATCS
jgi:flagellar assembly factor FliW